MKNLNLYQAMSLILCFTVISCAKDRFDDGIPYKAEYRGLIEKYNGTVEEHSVSGFGVILNNETKNTIDYDGVTVGKNGRNIEGVLPNFGLFVGAGTTHIKLKRELFGDNIYGTFTKTIPYNGEYVDLHGTIALER